MTDMVRAYAVRYRPGTELARRFPGHSQPVDDRGYLEQIVRQCVNAADMEIVEVEQ